MKVLMTGAMGQVAYELQRESQKHMLYAFSKDKLDITDVLQVNDVLEALKPDFVINTAAYTKVDKAEEESELAFAVNRDGAKNLSLACAKIGSTLLQLSTDYVFDGKKTNPYLETDAVNPLSIYGQSKWEGEEAIRQNLEKHFIIRVSGIFGVHGNNFVKTILKISRERPHLKIVNDQTTCPTPAKAIAEMIWKIIDKNSEDFGTYHYCSNPMTSWYEFAKNFVSNVTPIPTSEYPTPAKRPAYSALNCEKINKNFNIHQPNWKEGLKDVIRELSAS